MSRFKFKDPNTGQWVFTANKDEVDLKVDKVSGKGLSANDYTDEDKLKLAGIDVGAEVNPVIADDLTTDDPAKVLSANQGKILKDNADALADIVSTNVGDLETLTTTDKSSLVNATNEVKNLVDTNMTDLAEHKLDYTEHLNSTTPHQFQNLKTGKIYKYGYQLSVDGNPQVIYEEVI